MADQETGIRIKINQTSESGRITDNGNHERKDCSAECPGYESEDMSRNRSAHGPVLTMIFDRDGIIRFVHDGHASTGWNGCTEGNDYVGRRITDLDALTHAGLLESLTRLLAGESIDLIDIRSDTDDPEAGKRFNLFGAPFPGEGGAGGGVLIQEDTAWKEDTGEAVRRAKQQWEQIFDSVPDLIFVTDADRTIVRANRAMSDRFGLRPKELVGRQCHEIIPGTAARIDELVRDSNQLKDSTIVRETYSERLGGHFLMTLSPLFDREGRSSGLVHVWRDITAQKQVDEDLRAAHNEIAQIFESAGDGLCVIDRNYRVLRINEAFVRLTGLEGGALTGRYCYDLWPSGRCRTEQCPLNRILAGETLIEHNWEGPGDKTDLGSLCLMTGVPFRDPTGELVGMVQSIKDVSVKKRLEDQLLHAQKMEAVGRLAGGVAHDFNNLLSAINGYAELAQMDLDPDGPGFQEVREIQRAAAKATTLTGQLLAFSRKQRMLSQTLDLKEVLTDMEKILCRVIGEDVELFLNLQDPAGWIKADRGQIEQIIMNLVVNARDAMPSGGRMTLAARDCRLDARQAQLMTDVAPGSYVSLTVSDSGSGMDEKTLAHIFEPFFTTKVSGQGTGLGLSMVYGIVKQSNGHITVKSGVNQGSAFTILFPRVAGPAGNETGLTHQNGATGGNETILVVEDEDIVRKLTARMLSQKGYRVLQAAHSGEALLICERQQGPIHLMISDVVMPLMSGPELAERAIALRGGMKVMFMSGYADETMARHGFQMEEFPLLDKPFTHGQLHEMVRRVLDE